MPCSSPARFLPSSPFLSCGHCHARSLPLFLAAFGRVVRRGQPTRCDLEVNIHQRFLVIDVSEEKDNPQVFINPSFEVIEGELSEYDEGCLSVPGFYETVSRPRIIKVIAQDKAGEKFEIEAEGILSTCIQHEIDHLDGKLFVDYISTLKRDRIRSKLEKEHKQSA